MFENSDGIKEDMENLRSRKSPRPAIKRGWKCSGCGKINSPEDDYCECGLSKWD